MKYIVCVHFIILLLNIVFCEKCSTKNFDITWYKTCLNKPSQAKIFDEDIQEARIIERVPGQQIKKICERTIFNLTELYILNINSSGIEEIIEGSFENLPNLFKLDLSANNLEKINSGIFNGLNLRILYLNDNKIKKIDSTAFNNMMRLNIIKLSSNEIQEVHADWFMDTTNIIHLILDYNRIKELKSKTFKNLASKTGVLEDAKLLNIHLSFNKIELIQENAFDGLKQLGNIYLDRNKITTLHENIFSTLTHIKRIDLMDNQIHCLPENLPFLEKVDEIEIGGNPWNCTCLYRFNKWSAENKKNVMTAYVEWSKCLTSSLRDI